MALRSVALFFLLSPALCFGEKTVLILGGGIAGLQAAATLRSQDINFVLLESTNEVGGRVLTRLFQGRPINVGPAVINPGAQWIHGISTENPIWALASSDECNVTSAYFDFDTIAFYDADGDGFKTDQETSYADVDAVFDAIDVIAENPTTYAGMSLQEALNDEGSWTVDTSMKSAINWYAVDFEHAANSSQLSAGHIALPTYEVFGEDNHLITDSEGIQKIPKCIAKQANLVEGTNLHLNARVKTIDYGNTNITVTTVDGKSYSADYAIVTFSAGVLQHQGLDFVPPLPEDKQQAIEKFRMGLYETVYLKFPNNFWGETLKSVANSSQGVNNIFVGTSNRSWVFYFYNLAPFHHDWHTLAAVATGELALKMERQSINKTRDEIMDLLRQQYGNATEDPVDIYVPIWLDDDNFYGSYSYWPFGLTRSEFLDAKASISGKLYFAGEAFSEDFLGFMHGAYYTGEEAANCVVKKIKPDFNFNCTIPDKSSETASTPTPAGSAPTPTGSATLLNLSFTATVVSIVSFLLLLP